MNSVLFVLESGNLVLLLKVFQAGENNNNKLILIIIVFKNKIIIIIIKLIKWYLISKTH